MTRLISLLAALVLALTGTVAMAGEHMATEHHSRRDAEMLLAKAVEKLKADGPKKAFAAFDDRKGGFVEDELYVFAFNMKGTYMASGADPKLVGTDAYDLKSRDGKYLVREMIAKAKKNGQGEVDYAWLDRGDNQVEHKRSLIRRVGDYIVGVGYYAD